MESCRLPNHPRAWYYFDTCTPHSVGATLALVGQRFVFVNGVYDLACAVGILCWPGCLAGQLHVGMFKGDPVDMHRRMLAYWIVTYGVMRLFAQRPCMLAAATYAMEGAALAAECWVYGTAKSERVGPVAACCALLAWWCARGGGR